jgi:hypothetical protein
MKGIPPILIGLVSATYVSVLSFPSTRGAPVQRAPCPSSKYHFQPVFPTNVLCWDRSPSHHPYRSLLLRPPRDSEAAVAKKLPFGCILQSYGTTFPLGLRETTSLLVGSTLSPLSYSSPSLDSRRKQNLITVSPSNSFSNSLEFESAVNQEFLVFKLDSGHPCRSPTLPSV